MSRLNTLQAAATAFSVSESCSSTCSHCRTAFRTKPEQASQLDTNFAIDRSLWSGVTKQQTSTSAPSSGYRSSISARACLAQLLANAVLYVCDRRQRTFCNWLLYRYDFRLARSAMSHITYLQGNCRHAPLITILFNDVRRGRCPRD